METTRPARKGIRSPRSRPQTLREQIDAQIAKEERAAEKEAREIEALVGTAETEATGLAAAEPVNEMRSEPTPRARIEMRGTMREEDPRARAARRAQELRDHGGLDAGEFHDTFYIDPAIVPAGWAYEWKRRLVAGAEDPTYETNLARAGWEPVPAYRHPEMMPKGYQGNVERDGMLLMERPTEINEEIKHREYIKAKNQVRQKEDQLNSVEPGQFERRKSTGESLVKIGRSYEQIPIPKE